MAVCAIVPNCSRVIGEGDYVLYQEGGWQDPYHGTTLMQGYYVYGQDNSLHSSLAAFGLAGQVSLAAVMFAVCCCRCCARTAALSACRALLVMAHFAAACSFLLAGLFHRRLAFGGSLATPLDHAASVEIDGAEVANACFAEADLWWAWMVYSLRAGFAMLAGTLLAGCAALIFTCQARRLVWLVASWCALIGVAAFTMAVTVHNGAMMVGALSSHLPGAVLILAACFKGHMTDFCNMRCCSRRRDKEDGEADAQKAPGDDDSDEATKAARRMRVALVLLATSGVTFITAALWRDVLAGGDTRLGAFDTCESPCPSSCEYPLSFSVQVVHYIFLSFAWLLCDAAMALMLPQLQDELSMYSQMHRAAAIDMDIGT